MSIEVEDQMTVVYAIVTLFGEPRYVGQTRIGLPQRLARHIAYAKYGKRELDKWLWENPDISIIPLEVNPSDPDEAERRWIRNMRAGGIPILNIADGGRRGSTGFRHTEATKQRLSKAHRGKRLTKEHRQKLSDAHKGVSLSLEHRMAIGRGGKGRVVTPEQRENMARAKRGELNPMSRANRLRREGGG